MTRKTVLITGANGFVGTNLVNVLGNEAIKIKAMVLEGTPTEELKKVQNQGVKLEIVRGNLTKYRTLLKVCQGVDIIVHLAGIVTDWAPETLYQRINVEGTKKLLLAASKNDVSRVIFMSSLTVHSLSGHNYDDENTPRDMKKMAYGVSKKKAEDLISTWGKEKKGRDYAIVRPGFVIYGPHDRASFVQALDAMLKGKFGFVNGGESLISYVYVENLVCGIVQLIQADQVDGAYLIIDGNTSWRKWVEKWCKIGGAEVPKMNLPYGLLAPIVYLMEKIFKLFKSKKGPPLTLYRISIPRKNLAFESSRMKKEFGFKPPVSFEESLKRTLSYYKNHLAEPPFE